jgi:hypothetical protein
LTIINMPNIGYHHHHGCCCWRNKMMCCWGHSFIIESLLSYHWLFIRSFAFRICKIRRESKDKHFKGCPTIYHHCHFLFRSSSECQSSLFLLFSIPLFDAQCDCAVKWAGCCCCRSRFALLIVRVAYLIEY